MQRLRAPKEKMFQSQCPKMSRRRRTCSCMVVMHFPRRMPCFARWLHERGRHLSPGRRNGAPGARPLWCPRRSPSPGRRRGCSEGSPTGTSSFRVIWQRAGRRGVRGNGCRYGWSAIIRIHWKTTKPRARPVRVSKERCVGGQLRIRVSRGAEPRDLVEVVHGVHGVHAR